MISNRRGLTPRQHTALRIPLFASLAVCALLAWRPANADAWWQTRHGDFHIVSKLSRTETAKIARDIQIYQLGLAAFFPQADIQPHVPVTILLLDKSLWKQYLGNDGGKVGVAFPSDDHFHVVVNGDVWMQASNIVYHELTHLFMHKASGGSALPVWLDEGYADLLSTIEKDKGHVKVGIYPAWRLYSLMEAPWLPLQTLLGVSRSSPEYRSEKLAGAFYAQSWLMTHFYIFGNPERRKQISKYLMLVGENERPQSAFAEAFAGDRGEFEKELQRYSRQARLSYLKIPVPDAGKGMDSAVTELPPAAAAEEMAAWMLRYRPLDDADMKFLEQQARDAAASSAASLQLAIAYLRTDKTDLAKPRVDAGCAAPAGVRTAILCGDAYTLLNDSSQSTDSGQDQGTLLARQFFMAALQIEPHNVEALTRAADTYRSLGGDAQALLGALEKSLARDPNNPALAVGLATVLQHSDLMRARDYLERAIINVANPGRVQYLVKWLEYMEQQIAAGKAGSG